MNYNRNTDKSCRRQNRCFSWMKRFLMPIVAIIVVTVSGCSTIFKVKERVADAPTPSAVIETKNVASPGWEEENDTMKKEMRVSHQKTIIDSEEPSTIQEAEWVPELKDSHKGKKRSKSKRRKKKKSRYSHLPVYGYVEKVLVGEEKLRVKAKLDTGAGTSSLHAVDMIEFERDGKKWMRFHMENPKTRELIRFERKLKRYAKVKQHEGESQIRPVILMEVMLGETYIQREFSLTNRDNFLYPVLLGRNFLNGIALVDASQAFLAKKGHYYASDQSK